VIIIKKVWSTIKYFSIFTLLEILIAFIMGLFNLIGLNSSLTKIIILIINLLVFFFFGFQKGKKTNKKGFLEGIINGIILITILFTITIIFFHQILSLATLFYYMALIFASVVGSTIGKNKKIDSTFGDKK